MSVLCGGSALRLSGGCLPYLGEGCLPGLRVSASSVGVCLVQGVFSWSGGGSARPWGVSVRYPPEQNHRQV